MNEHFILCYLYLILTAYKQDAREMAEQITAVAFKLALPIKRGGK